MLKTRATTGTKATWITTLCGHRVMVAYRDPSNAKVLHAERLLNLDDLYGTVTAHGTLYKRTSAELVEHLWFVFDVDEVRFTRTTLVA